MNIYIRFIAYIFCSFLALTPVHAGETAKREVLFDYDWFFHLGDIDNNNSSLTEWKKISLPHDWSIELPFSEASAGGVATGHKDGGAGWYLKKFRLSDNDSNKIITLYFEGIYMESEIWINGKKVYYHPNGYTSYRCEITKYCTPPGMENEIKIKVQNRGKNSRWYSGSGIYRHVWLIKTNKIYLDKWNTFITTERIDGDKAYINISTTMFNKTAEPIRGKFLIEIYDYSGNLVYKYMSDRRSFQINETTINKKFIITNPELWSPESPNIYKAIVYAVKAGKQIDNITVPFGVRTLAFSSENGFQLNGKSLKLKGGCLHHDNGFLGAIAVDRAEIRKAELIKANGFNAVRCSHNPPSEKFLEACDTLGLLVIDEAFDQWEKPKNPDDYHQYFDEWGLSDIESIVRRDRNHPCIIMWSIGNEIQERADSAGILIAHKLKNTIRLLDTTRPVTAAVNEFWDNPDLKWKDSESAFRYLDVCGYNYMWREYENDHRQYPNRIIYGSESTATERAINWDLTEANSYIIGDFVWTAMDYLGESGIGNTGYYAKDETKYPQFMDYPWFNGWCGDIDICGNAKPQSFLRNVIWRNSNIAMIVHAHVPDGKKEKVSYWGWPDEQPSWNWTGNENKTLKVRVFTRYPVVRLYLNGLLLAEKIISDDTENKYTAVFEVPYQKGELKAIGMSNKFPADSVSLRTTGKAAGIRLTSDRNKIHASPNDLAYISIEIVDKDGNVVPDEDKLVAIKLTGDGNVFAGNADPTDMKSFRSSTPQTFRGKAMAIVRPTGKSGKITLEVTNKEIGTNSITISAY